MIYITGDTHGEESRFRQFKKLFPKRRDFLLHCGDFGFVWDGSPAEQKKLARLEQLDCNLLFVEGTHDNLDLLQGYPEEEFCGGRVRRLGKNLFWMQRGEIFTLDGVRVFALGGGESEDADEREAGVTWWPDELPTPEELVYAQENLAKVDYTVDIILTHHHPHIELGVVDARSDRINALTAFLRQVAQTAKYQRWYFGGVHLDRVISPKLTSVFEKVIPYRV